MRHGRALRRGVVVLTLCLGTVGYLQGSVFVGGFVVLCLGMGLGIEAWPGG